MFGSQVLPGGQAQYVRVPKAGGTLFKIPPDQATSQADIARWNSLSDSSLLLLADILPTGVFAVTQMLQHPNILPVINSKPFPIASFIASESEKSSATLLTDNLPPLTNRDKQLTLAIIGLGPVGLVSGSSLGRYSNKFIRLFLVCCSQSSRPIEGKKQRRRTGYRR